MAGLDDFCIICVVFIVGGYSILLIFLFGPQRITCAKGRRRNDGSVHDSFSSSKTTLWSIHWHGVKGSCPPSTIFLLPKTDRDTSLLSSPDLRSLIRTRFEPSNLLTKETVEAACAVELALVMFFFASSDALTSMQCCLFSPIAVAKSLALSDGITKSYLGRVERCPIVCELKLTDHEVLKSLRKRVGTMEE